MKWPGVNSPKMSRFPAGFSSRRHSIQELSTESISHNTPCLELIGYTLVSHLKNYLSCTQTHSHCSVMFSCMRILLRIFPCLTRLVFALSCLPCLCFGPWAVSLFLVIVCCLPWPLPVLDYSSLALVIVVCWCLFWQRSLLIKTSIWILSPLSCLSKCPLPVLGEVTFKNNAL